MNSKELVKSVIVLSFLALVVLFLFEIKLGLLYIFIALILSLVVNPFNKLLKSRLKLSEALSSIFSVTMLVSVISMIIVLFVPILTKQGKNLSLLNTSEFRNKFKSTSDGIINYLESKNVSIIDFLQILILFLKLILDLLPNYSIQSYLK